MNDLHEIALAKRFFECITKIPSFEDLYKKNPYIYLKALGINDDSKWYEYTMTNNRMYARHPGTPLDDFIKIYMEREYDMINKSMDNRIIPENTKMKNWRLKQIERCISEDVPGQIHMPIAFELTSGCSVGCEFCALGSSKLNKIFHGTPSNLEFFETLVDVSVDIIGMAAAHTILYYSSEPLDNPDYEKFEEIIYKKTGIYPQITTAVPLRNVERTKNFLHKINQKPQTYHRFSVREPSDLFQIYTDFTPEEMIYTLVEPRFIDVKKTMVSSGRMAKKTGFYKGTIACVSGFVVNLCEKTISLRSPCSATAKNPTGEITYSTQKFLSPLDYSIIMRKLINDVM